jgi:cytochrome c oxidase subunit 3
MRITTSNPDVFEGLDPSVKVRTRKMMMWLIIFAVVMLFGGITSAMIVLYGKLTWIHVNPPASLLMSNVIIVLSSAALILALRKIKNGQQNFGLRLHIVAWALGVLFLYTQNAGWNDLSAKGMGYTITEDDKGLKSYRWNTFAKLNGEYGVDYWLEMNNQRLIFENGEFYLPDNATAPVTNKVLTTFNAFGALLSVLIYVHIVHLVLGLIYLSVNTYRIAKGKIHQGNTLSIYISGMYWHFMGGLWLYLFAFMFLFF